MKRVALPTLGLGAIVLLLFTAQARSEEFHARLSPMPVDVQISARVKGAGTATGRLDGRSLVVSGGFEGLGGPATAARLHESPVIGVRGPAIFDLEVAGRVRGSISGRLELSREQLASLRQGRLYIQIHSELAPEGNLWGWLLPAGSSAGSQEER